MSWAKGDDGVTGLGLFTKQSMLMREAALKTSSLQYLIKGQTLNFNSKLFFLLGICHTELRIGHLST